MNFMLPFIWLEANHEKGPIYGTIRKPNRKNRYLNQRGKKLNSFHSQKDQEENRVNRGINESLRWTVNWFSQHTYLRSKCEIKERNSVRLRLKLRVEENSKA